MQEFPTIRTHVSSFVSGSGDDIHVLVLDCLFTQASADEPDEVGISIMTEHINTHPKIHVDISWGHPSGYVEADLFESPTDLSKSTLDAIEAGLPKLYETLTAVIRRGRPPTSEAENDPPRNHWLAHKNT
jgi:hypothetical protein